MFFFQPRTLQKFAQESQSGATNSVTSNGDKGASGDSMVCCLFKHIFVFVLLTLNDCGRNCGCPVSLNFVPRFLFKIMKIAIKIPANRPI